VSTEGSISDWMSVEKGMTTVNMSPRANDVVATTSGLRQLRRDVKVLGGLTALALTLTSLTLGTSIYVVSSRQLETNGGALVNSRGAPVSTEAAETTLPTLGEALRQGPAMLEKLKALAFQAETPDGDAEIVMHVGRVFRLDNGITTVYGTAGDALSTNVSTTAQHEELSSATYTAQGSCVAGCRVLLRAPSEVRRGRKLHFQWWNPFSWFSSHGLHYAPECASAGGTEVARRWEYTSCVCRFRFWNCGDDKAKHVRTCTDNSDGSRFNLVYEDCQTIPAGALP